MKWVWKVYVFMEVIKRQISSFKNKNILHLNFFNTNNWNKICHTCILNHKLWAKKWVILKYFSSVWIKNFFWLVEKKREYIIILYIIWVLELNWEIYFHPYLFRNRDIMHKKKRDCKLKNFIWKISWLTLYFL